jgi:WD40 repeat protein
MRGVSIVITGLTIAVAATTRADDAAELEAHLVTTISGHKTEILEIALSADGKTLATGGGEDKTIRFWDAATGKELGKATAHEGSIYSLAFTADGKTLISGGNDGKIGVWDVATRKLRKKIDASKKYVVAVIPSVDGKTVFASTDEATSPAIWDAVKGKVIVKEQKSDVELNRIFALAPKSQLLASADTSSDVWLWDAKTGKQVRRVKGDEFTGVQSLAFSPDGATLAVGNIGSINLIESESGKLTKIEVEGPVMFEAVCFTPDGKTLVTVSDDGKIQRWGVANREVQAQSTFPAGEPYRKRAVLSANAKFAAVKVGNTKVQVYEVPNSGPSDEGKQK